MKIKIIIFFIMLSLNFANAETKTIEQQKTQTSK